MLVYKILFDLSRLLFLKYQLFMTFYYFFEEVMTFYYK